MSGGFSKILTKSRPCPHGPHSPAPTASPPVSPLSPCIQATLPVPGPSEAPSLLTWGLGRVHFLHLQSSPCRSLSTVAHFLPSAQMEPACFPDHPSQFSTCYTSHNLRLPCFCFVYSCFPVSPRECKYKEWTPPVPFDPSSAGTGACHLIV